MSITSKLTKNGFTLVEAGLISDILGADVKINDIISEANFAGTDESHGYVLYVVSSERYLAQGEATVRGGGWRLARELNKARTFVRLADAEAAARKIAARFGGLIEVRSFAIRATGVAQTIEVQAQ